MTLEKRYNAKDIEERIYKWWEESGFFNPDKQPNKDSSQDPYVIVIPPPNVTGILHMGHALNNTIQDIMIRWNRMKGRETLWVPGVDHAGIATQNVVEKKLAKEDKTRWDLGREKFLEEVWQWKEDHGNTITNQLRRLGASCDWSREAFTMDENLSAAVREVFVKLYEKDLIYQGNYLVNWCPRCETALSDEEAEHEEVEGGLYHLRYPIVGCEAPYQQIGKDHIVVATTRPETMLGDTAVAVHPEDERYKDLIGKKVLLPLVNREIPVISDEYVDPEFGTGMVKITPAHDPNDFEMGKRHNLEFINVMTPNGKINAHGGSYEGLDRFQARKKIIADLEEQGLFIQRDTHTHAVGHCYRCHDVVEPYLSKQWFVKMKPLADKALKAHEEGKTVFYPDRWTKVYLNWLTGIRDWCISRQIWWGHQIPAWYDDEGNTYVARSEDEAKKQAVEKRGKEVSLRQDEDVLDTWFSSWLWPFSTLGWPQNDPEDLKRFYPGSDLITAPEIIYFWVARMIMSGLEFLDDIPFSKIYLHGTVRDDIGRKMSKSLGNSIDPLEVIDEMGADALRFSLVMLSAQDVYLSREKFETGRNFTNKLWNACRFVLMGLEGFDQGSSQPDQFDFKNLHPTNQWILSQLEKKTAEAEKYLHQFGMSQSSTELYHFVWNDFCDWFIELSKSNMKEGSERKEETQKVLFFVCERILRLLHPFMPFTTEEIWQKFKEKASDQENWAETLMYAKWPYQEEKLFEDKECEEAIEYLKEAITGVRDIRARLTIPPAKKLKVTVHGKSEKVLPVIEKFQPEFMTVAKLEELELKESFSKTDDYAVNSFADLDVYVLTTGLIDTEKEKERLSKKIAETEKYVNSLNGKLSNKNFVDRAPKDVVEKEKEKLNEAEKLLLSYKEQLAQQG